MPDIRFMIAASIGACIAADCRADDIRLASGEILHVEILERTETTIRFSHPVLGEMSLPLESMEILPAAATPPQADSQPAPAAATTSPATATSSDSASSGAAPAAAPPPTEPEPPPKDWKFRLVFAGADAQGNTDTASVSTLFTASRETPRLKTVIDASYFFARSDGETSENRFSTGFRHDWLKPESKWFEFVDGRFDFDEFQSWRYRAQGHVGLGYHLISPPKLKLDVNAGLGVVKQWESDDDNLRPEGLFGFNGEYAIAAKHTIKFSSIVYPDLIDITIYRWVNSAAWSWTIDSDNNLALTAGVQQEYQSQVDPGDEHNDLRIYAGLQLDF